MSEKADILSEYNGLRYQNGIRFYLRRKFPGDKTGHINWEILGYDDNPIFTRQLYSPKTVDFILEKDTGKILAYKYNGFYFGSERKLLEYVVENIKIVVE